MTLELVTHDGKFHADELLSSVILKDLYPDAVIIRSRDPATIAPGPRKIVYDVGQIFDPEQMCFDHHQIGAPKRIDGVPYSSFGMIWEHFGRTWLKDVAGVPEDDVERAHQGIDRGFVCEVDSLDNGIAIENGNSALGLTRILESFSPDFDNMCEASEMNAFTEAMGTARTVFAHYARNVAARIRSAKIVTEILEKHDGGPVLVLPYGMPWEGPMRKMKADHILFALINRQDSWSISTVRIKPGAFENRLDLPEAWAGLTGDALVDACGIPDAQFVHKARFFAVAGSYEGALAMVNKALEIGLAPADTPVVV